ncbi:LEAF RUST 10 DISEASE-RESISTANCE LOCUS RECEPTOR-LIKE PROTEIN KINASE 2.4 [Trifolium repens]|nr:LEAF RUST 10 DISEASE-RESISTANCE LOCUS RECEPTOR-LIKE PROTEIN KINASE 2.4 [Trifolium repens]
MHHISTRPKECGYPSLNLACIRNISYITINDVEYQVLEADHNLQTLRITREDYFQEGLCPTKHVNTTLDTDLFVYGSNYNNLTLFYGCPASITFPSPSGRFPCNSNGYSDDFVYTWLGSNNGSQAFSCQESMVVPILSSLFDVRNIAKVQSAIKDGFVVRWIAGIDDCVKCQISGGFCGYDWISKETTCYCRDQSCSNFVPDYNASSGMSKRFCYWHFLLIIT